MKRCAFGFAKPSGFLLADVQVLCEWLATVPRYTHLADERRFASLHPQQHRFRHLCFACVAPCVAQSSAIILAIRKLLRHVSTRSQFFACHRGFVWDRSRGPCAHRRPHGSVACAARFGIPVVRRRRRCILDDCGVVARQNGGKRRTRV